MRVVPMIVTVAVVAGAGYWWWSARKDGETESVLYRTMPVQAGEIVRTIRATGTIEPEDLIDIGAQVTGQIMSFGSDVNGNEVDYCSVVTKGQLLARIDDVTYRAEVTIAKANLTTAEANLESAKADILQYEARLLQAERDWTRAQSLGVGDALSQKDFDAYRSAYDVAAATLAVGKAQKLQAEASISQAQAQLEKAERNLSYCNILSTVDGVIIDRRVNIGQTVTASMSTPSLFLVAKDLRKIEIWVPVNEADIGAIAVGTPVTFTVDAFPGRSFTGEVRRIRLNASMTSNVVTYTVEVATSNDDGLLLPYLTANVAFELERSAPDALHVPPAALLWKPEGWEVEGDYVFVRDAAGRPVPVPVTVGTTNDARTVVVSDSLKPGDAVIVGTMTPLEASQQAAKGKNPFMSVPSPPPKRR